MKKSAHSLAFIQPHLVSDHCDELRVGGFSAQVMDGVAEVAVEGVHIAPVPCNLDGVADGALHPAGGGAVFLGDFRVQALGDGVDVLRLVHGEQDGIPQELVALDVSGHGIRVGNKSKSKSYYLLVQSRTLYCATSIPHSTYKSNFSLRFVLQRMAFCVRCRLCLIYLSESKQALASLVAHQSFMRALSLSKTKRLSKRLLERLTAFHYSC